MSSYISNTDGPVQFTNFNGSMCYQTGWVCPKCGAVMAPWQNSCIYCRPKEYTNVIFTTDTLSKRTPDEVLRNELNKSTSSSDNNQENK